MTDDELIIKLNNLAESLEGTNAETVSDAAARLDELLGELQDANEEATEVRNELEALEADDNFASDLYAAIVERRTEDAVDILRKMVPNDFMDPKSYANLFPDRIR